MTLTVSVVYIDELTGKILDEIPLPRGAELAGFERWRNSVYGSPESEKLGLPLLNSLKHQDILACGEDVLKLKAETMSLLDSLHHEHPYDHRLGNIIRACELAITHGAAVWIS